MKALEVKVGECGMGTRRASGEGGTTKGLTAADLTIQTCWDADRLVDTGDRS